ncbi:hypothetical protein HK100_001434 [Physocladia obscura]|uniref:Homeobox domain-containing protein n=1 Tax=Physocladia obscura TaxID=109957 RepID=A0AAD5T899_9FUNG|nr:hypothetical protein HK100_001434 [Physocladia obscura]
MLTLEEYEKILGEYEYINIHPQTVVALSEVFPQSASISTANSQTSAAAAAITTADASGMSTVSTIKPLPFSSASSSLILTPLSSKRNSPAAGKYQMEQQQQLPLQQYQIKHSQQIPTANDALSGYNMLTAPSFRISPEASSNHCNDYGDDSVGVILQSDLKCNGMDGALERCSGGGNGESNLDDRIQQEFSSAAQLYSELIAEFDISEDVAQTYGYLHPMPWEMIEVMSRSQIELKTVDSAIDCRIPFTSSELENLRGGDSVDSNSSEIDFSGARNSLLNFPNPSLFESNIPEHRAIDGFSSSSFATLVTAALSSDSSFSSLTTVHETAEYPFRHSQQYPHKQRQQCHYKLRHDQTRQHDENLLPLQQQEQPHRYIPITELAAFCSDSNASFPYIPLVCSENESSGLSGVGRIERNDGTVIYDNPLQTIDPSTIYHHHHQILTYNDSEIHTNNNNSNIIIESAIEDNLEQTITENAGKIFTTYRSDEEYQLKHPNMYEIMQRSKSFAKTKRGGGEGRYHPYAQKLASKTNAETAAIDISMGTEKKRLSVVKATAAVATEKKKKMLSMSVSMTIENRETSPEITATAAEKDHVQNKQQESEYEQEEQLKLQQQNISKKRRQLRLMRRPKAMPKISLPLMASTSVSPSFLTSVSMNADDAASEGNLSGSTNGSASGTPYLSTASHSRKSRPNHNPKVTEYLFQWLMSHQHEPYPNDEEKRAMATDTGLSLNQINDWFINARRRYLEKPKHLDKPKKQH